MTPCPYVPPHEWNTDFPHLLQRIKVVNHRQGKLKLRDRLLISAEMVGSIAGIPVIAEQINAADHSNPLRQLAAKTAGIHVDAILPQTS